jgi:hypothetical protein
MHHAQPPEDLPYIDERVRPIDATADQVWRALLATMGPIGSRLPHVLRSAWALNPDERTGEWNSTVAVGDSLVGFDVIDARAPRSLVLRGRHRFSRYELRFEITDGEHGGSVLHAHSSAEFPGAAGRLYRALVIGTGGHRIAVRSILARVAKRAAAIYG